MASAEYQREYRKGHLEAARARDRRSGAVRRKIVRALLDAAKAQPCMDCKKRYPAWVMDFDHRPGEDKVRNLGRMYTSSEAAVLSEIAKCDLVCANCHRERTHKRMLEKGERDV